jgi:hypothetical protein
MLRRIFICKSTDISGEHVASDFYLFHAGFMLDLFFEPEDGGDIFFRNVGWLSAVYKALYPKRQK